MFFTFTGQATMCIGIPTLKSLDTLELDKAIETR